MPFYNHIVYYENKEVNSEYIRKTKEAVCRNSEGSSFSIKNNSVSVGDFSQDNNIKIVDYDVDFDVYSIKKQQRMVGTSRVRLAIHNDKIIGEFHKRLTN